MFEAVFSEHGGVHFDDDVEVAVGNEEGADAFDFVGGAAMEGGEGDAG